MSYSNTNRAKRQVLITKAIIGVIVTLVLMVVITLNLINISNQLETIREAKKINLELKNRILKLKEENRVLENKIAWATTSAYIKQQARDKFGLGTADDYWLLIPKNEQKYDIFPKLEEKVNTPIWKQWRNLFRI